MEWLIIIGFVCLGAFIGIVINNLQKVPGKMLQQDFVALGNLQGKTLDEIKEKVGAPNAIQSCTVADTGKNGSLCTWAKLPYSITLLFDESNVCLGVNKEITEK